MQINKFFLIIIFFSLNISYVFGVNFSHMSLFKDARIMSRGGVDIAIGGSNHSIFSNPAGLSQFDVNKGMDFDLLNLNAVTSSSNIMLFDEVSKILENVEDKNNNNIDNEKDDQIIAIIELLEEHLGKNNYAEFSNFSAIGKKIDEIGFVIGSLVGVNINTKAHRSGFSSEGIIETDAIGYGGFVGGASYDLIDNKLFVGFGIKTTQTYSVSKYFSADELVENFDQEQEDITNYLNNLSESKVFLTVDLGTIYRLTDYIYLGASYMNMTYNMNGIGQKETALYVPPMFNLGMSFIGETDYSTFENQHEFRLGIDYVDVLYGYESDKSLIKRTRIGGDVDIFDSKWVTAVLGAGLYQGEYTAGLSLRLAIFELDLTTYAEEMGAYAGQDPDRRYIFNFRMGW